MCCDPMAVFVSHARLSKDVYCHVQRQIENPMLFFLTLLELSMALFKFNLLNIYTPQLSSQSICPSQPFPFYYQPTRIFPVTRPKATRTNLQLQPSTMPKQGPGTKLVLKGLRLAFPEIAAQREREEQEEREERERKQHPSREGDDDGAQQRQAPPSMHSNAAGKSRGSRFQDDNAPRESARRGTSVRSIVGDGRHQSQQRRDTGSRASQHRPSHTGSRTSQFHSRDITGRRFSRDDNKPDISKDGGYSHSSRRATGESYSNDNGGRSRGTASVQGGAESRGSRARMSGRGSGAATIEEYT